VNESSAPDSSPFPLVVTTSRLTKAGASPDRIRRLVQQRALHRIARGVYLPAPHGAGTLTAGILGSWAGDHSLRLAAFLAHAGSETVVSHRTAALIHGLDLLGPERDGIVSVTRPPGGAGSRTGSPGILVHAAHLPRGQVTTRAGVRLTSVARTVVDLARSSPFTAGVVAADSALRSNQVTRAELDAVLTACARWPGISKARRVVAFSDGRAESVFESISRVVFDEHGLPAPDLQVWVGGEDEVVGRVDFLWRAYRTVGEADGAAKYSVPGRVRAQLWRDERLREAGFEVVHFSWHEVRIAPWQVAAQIRAAFQRGLARARKGASA
jgi:hypothetical protein